MTGPSLNIIPVAEQACRIERRLAEISDETTRLCLHAGPAIDIEDSIQALHTERDVLDACLAGIRAHVQDSVEEPSSAGNPPTTPTPHLLKRT